MIDTKVLYGVALLSAALAGGLYYYSDPKIAGMPQLSSGMDYSARDIRLLQTDANGQMQSRTLAQQLRHFSQDDRSELSQVDSIWYQNGQPRATLLADYVLANRDYQQIELRGRVMVSQIGQQSTPTVVLKTESLRGYPRQKRIETTHPVLIDSAQGQMTSQGLSANLAEGQYQFNHIRIQYAPALRP